MVRRSLFVRRRLCSFAPYSSLGVVDWPVSGAGRHCTGVYAQPGLVPTRLLQPPTIVVAGTSYPPVGNKNNIIPIRGFTNWWLCVVAGIGKIRKIFGADLMTHTRPATHPTPPAPSVRILFAPCLPAYRPAADHATTTSQAYIYQPCSTSLIWLVVVGPGRQPAYV